MAAFWDEIRLFLWNIINRPTLVDYIDIVIVAFLIYQLVMLTRQTRAIQVLKGLAVLIVIYYISSLVGFTMLNWVLRTILNSGALLVVVLFQPEFRRVLEQLGRGTKLDRLRDSVSENQRIVDELTQCCLRLSKRRVGALIVFEQQTGLKDIMETGTPIDSLISAPLLENIFEPNTPLHDGAVIIRGQRIVSAACVLTLSESKALSRDLGTRHRAALGVSESTDAIALIVSEETGTISLARAGKMIRHLDADSLKKELTQMYADTPSPLRTALNAFRHRKEKRDAQ